MKKQYIVAAAMAGVLLPLGAFTVNTYAARQGRYGYNQNGQQGNGNQIMTAVPTTNQAISDADKQTLQFMLEEEKLAMDIYNALYEKWGSRVFANIAKSESKHQQTVLRAVNYYGVADVRSSEAGVFNNPELQTLYNTLLAKGMLSQQDAYEVGKTIEETDIADLVQAQNDTNVAYLDTIYSRLQKASQNHLNAFNRYI
jgi:hypothetical protein